MIVADENMISGLLNKLRTSRFEVFSIRENLKGESDNNIIELTKDNKGILITEDKDFGELVFSHNIRGCSVILLRYKNVSEYGILEDKVIQILNRLLMNPVIIFLQLLITKLELEKFNQNSLQI
ncbi:MAG: DUF5615 family PIN-like protein [Ignavibacteriae bacterium]|nr:DUF5615 family PIN-like protein [Ignavibacteriota bacterium]